MEFNPGFLYHNFHDHFSQKVVHPDGSTPAKPTNFSLTPTLRCDCRCVMCHLYRKRDGDLDLASVEHALGQIRRWLGHPFWVNISGGEVLVFKDIYRLIAFCRENSIYPKITTNGALLDAGNCRRLIQAGLEYLSVSVDSLRAEIHDGLRGRPGVLDKALTGIGRLERHGLKVGVNTVISSRNLDELESLVRRLFEEQGIARLSFQPVEPTLGAKVSRSDFRRSALWVNDLPKLASTLQGLIRLKKRYAIVNSAEELRSYYAYFRDPGAPRYGGGRRCLVGTTNFIINVKGDIRYCWELEPIGSIYDRDFSPPSVWNSARAKAVRLQTIRCSRDCTAACYRSTSLAQKVKYYLFLR